MGLLEDLLARGYFPIQLPPAFSTSSFSTQLAQFIGQWPTGTPPNTSAEKYSVARSSYYRRTTALVNPIGFYFLAKEIATHWPQIDAHYKKTQISQSIPEIGIPTSLRAIELQRFSALHEEKITRSSGYKYALVTDVTSFFPAIYTHTIPWALHTKAVAKGNKGKDKHRAQLLGNILDVRCMGLQDGQTIGLPIGPDTSHILAEIIAVAIDLQLRSQLGSWPEGFRYVDDFFFFFTRREEAEKALAVITKAVSEFELYINPAKTRIIEVKELAEESWKYRVKKLSIRPSRRQQRDDIHHFFESLFSMEKAFADESLVKYGLKRLTTTIIKKSNWPILESYLLKCGYSFPNTLQVIARLLSTYNHYDYPINQPAISRFCNDMIRTSAISNHHGEVSWLLWICKEFGFALEAGLAAEIARMPSSVCRLLVLDLYHSQITPESLPDAILKPIASEVTLTGSDWLLAYEAGRREWLHNTNDRFIQSHPYFGPMLAADVQFYNEDTKLLPLFQFTTPQKPDGDFDFDFDTDQQIDESFEFEDADEEYSDSGRSDDSAESEEDTDDTEPVDF
ncbi:MAG: RNA-directed DNA polymerase [Steroidobacteraceae bacterium]